jgi:hypothetical protein
VRWRKLGIVYRPSGKFWWNKLYAILPTPIIVESQNLIRVYFSTTCVDRFGRVTFIDLDIGNPLKVINNSAEILLDIGPPGCFDDCGVNVSCIITIHGKQYLYYAGYQRHLKVPYSILSGLAVSDDGISFSRYSKTPILERTDLETNVRSAPFIINEHGLLRMWYVSGKSWSTIAGAVHKEKLMPIYELKYGESIDGVNWKIGQEAIFKLEKDEFGFGRPYVFKENGIYKLFYSIRRKSVSYRIGYAESSDGYNWHRLDRDVGIDVSESGWDSEMICYPAVIKALDKTYLFYNGNKNGESGFGVAVLEE